MKTTKEERNEVRAILRKDRGSISSAWLMKALDDLEELAVNAAHVVECEAEREKVSAFDLSRIGGEWLGAARNWLQWHKRNEDAWGSGAVIEPHMTMRDVEDLAAYVAAAAMRKQPTERRVEQCLRARWEAERKLETARDILNGVARRERDEAARNEGVR